MPFPFDNLSKIVLKFCICTCTKNVLRGSLNGQLSIISDRVMALVSFTKKKNCLGSSLLLYCLEYHDETSYKCLKY